MGSGTFTPLDTQEDQGTFTPIGEGDARLLQANKQQQSKQSPALDTILTIAHSLFSPFSAQGRDTAVDVARPFVGNAAGLAAAAGAGIATKNPIVAFGAETQGYSAADTLMQYLKSQRPNSIGEAFGEAEKNALVNAVGGRILGGIVRGVSAARNANVPEIYKLYPTSSQALEHYGYSKLLSTPVKILEDVFAPGSKNAAQQTSGWASFQKALQLSNLMNGRAPEVNADPNQLLDSIKNTLESGINKTAVKGQFQQPQHYVSQQLLDNLNTAENPFKVLDGALADKSTLQKYLSLGQQIGPSNLNVRGDLQAYNWNKLMQDVTDVQGSGKARINVDKLNRLWNDPSKQDVLDTLYGKGMKGDLDNFLKNVTNVQDTQMQFPGLSKIKYLGNGWSLGGPLLTGLSLSGFGAGKLAATGLYLSGKVMGNLLTKPGIARSLAAMAGSEPLGQTATAVTKSVYNALQGSTIAILDNNGQKHFGEIEKTPDGSYRFKE